MRKSMELDYLLENAVAAALGLEKPHSGMPKRVRAARPKSPRHQSSARAPKHEHDRAAA